MLLMLLVQEVPPSETEDFLLDCRTSVAPVKADTRSLTLVLECSFSSVSLLFIFLGFSLKLLDRRVGYIRSSPTRKCSSALSPWQLDLASAPLDVASSSCLSSAGDGLEARRGPTGVAVSRWAGLEKTPPMDFLCNVEGLWVGEDDLTRGKDAAASRRSFSVLSRLASP